MIYFVDFDITEFRVQENGCILVGFKIVIVELNEQNGEFESFERVYRLGIIRYEEESQSVSDDDDEL